MLVKGFFGKYDELFGTKYVEEFSGYYSSYEMIDSGHHLSEEGAKQIFKNIDDYWESVRILENMQKDWWIKIGNGGIGWTAVRIMV